MTRSPMQSALRPLARLVPALLVALSLVAVVPTLAPLPAAAATDFDPGHLISDQTFYDSSRMSAPQIASFLQSKGAACNSLTTSAPCLKDYAQTTSARAATAYCSDYPGGVNLSAAQIIADVARVCGINPQVLLVTLQKEEGLVTTTSPTAGRYQTAMGFGCPDSSVCDSQYYGFFNQLYSAASQFQRYKASPTRYGYVAGRYNTILYNPNTACGSSQVYIQNQATAGLYNYTPYQPNAAALATQFGTGDSCSAYGNRNFVNYFTLWFGSPISVSPFGVVDTVVTNGPFITVQGWAIDPDTTDPIRVDAYLDGAGAASATANLNRPDLVPVYNRGAAHGFSVPLPVSGAGTHSVCLFAIDSGGAPNTLVLCKDVTLSVSAPMLYLDSTSSTDKTITVNGWAMTPYSPGPVRVDAYVDGQGAASTTASSSRPDVAAAFGNGDQHGYSLTMPVGPGSHSVCVYAINPYGPNHTQRCTTVYVGAAAPIGVYDSLSATPGRVRVVGWALSQVTGGSMQAQLNIDGKAVTTVTANAARPDVAAAYGTDPAKGIDVQLDATPGTRNVCVTAVNPSTGGTAALGCRSISVPSYPPVGNIDSITTAPGTITVSGWALSWHTTDPIRVDTYVDWVGATSGLAADPRPDVAAVYGKGPNHGYTITLKAPAGSHTVCQYAINPFGPQHTQLGCTTVTVP